MPKGSVVIELLSVMKVLVNMKIESSGTPTCNVIV